MSNDLITVLYKSQGLYPEHKDRWETASDHFYILGKQS